MDMQPVESSNVCSVGYADGELRVRFKSGRTYRYWGEGIEQHYHGLLTAESPGTYFALHIRSNPEIKWEPL